MKRTFDAGRFAACGFLIGALAGCSASPSPNLYVLTPLAAASQTAGESGGPAVGVGPVTLAPHLDRPQIVDRSGHRIRLQELERWAEPLRDGITRAVAENLAVLVGSEEVWIHPWRPSQPIDYQVRIEVLRSDLEGGEAVFSARFTVADRDGEVLAVRRSDVREPAADPEATAAALSRALASMSREIAGVLSDAAAAAD